MRVSEAGGEVETGDIGALVKGGIHSKTETQS